MARNFPGSAGSYLRVSSSHSAIDFGGTALTVSVFIKPDVQPGGSGPQIAAKEDGVSGLQWDLYYQSNVLQGRISDGAGSDAVIASTTLSLTNWSHVVLRKNGTGANALQIYLNTVVDGQVTSNRTMQSSAIDLYVGDRGQTDSPWDGLIAELAIWDLSLTPTEITQLYNGTRANTIQVANLRGYWPICGITSPESDFSVNNLHANVVGSPIYAVHPFNNPLCGNAPFAPPSHVGGRGAA